MSQPGDSDGDHQMRMEREERFPTESAMAAAMNRTGFAAERPYASSAAAMDPPPPDWRSGSRQSRPLRQQAALDLGFMGSRGVEGLPPPPRTLQGPLPPSFPSEFAIMQRQRLAALQREQARRQRMNEALGYMPRSRPPVTGSGVASVPPPMESHFGRAQALARQRLKRRRRPDVTSSKRLSRRGNSFPMPRTKAEGDEHNDEIRIESMKVYRQKWDDLTMQAKLRFPLDTDKQRQYTKCRFASALGSRFNSVSFKATSEYSDDDDSHGLPSNKKRRVIGEL